MILVGEIVIKALFSTIHKNDDCLGHRQGAGNRPLNKAESADIGVYIRVINQIAAFIPMHPMKQVNNRVSLCVPWRFIAGRGVYIHANDVVWRY